MALVLTALAATLTLAGSPEAPRVGASGFSVTGDATSGFTLARTDAPTPGVELFGGWIPTAPAPSGVEATVTATPSDGGLDLAWSFTNHRDAAVTLSSLPLPSFSVGDPAYALNFIGSGWAQRLSARESTGPRRMQATYPGELYSPVAVLIGESAAVGVTLQYDVMGAKHDVSLSIEPGEPGRWNVLLRLDRSPEQGDGVLRTPARLQPGERREYRASIRATANRESWIDTLAPYWHWFHDRFGGVTYTKDPAAIRGCLLCLSSEQSDGNPQGWVPEAKRPDRRGYAGVVQVLAEALRQSNRAILWTPTGMAWRNKELNYPFQFTTYWRDDPNGTMASAPDMLQSAQFDPSRSWGLWWGHSADFNPAWDTLPMTPLDPNSPAQRDAALAELRLAVASGATTVGLDAFSHASVPVWTLIPWLQELQKEAPTVRFCTEGRAPDVMHRLSPTWLDFWRFAPDRFGESNLIRGPFLLADWLLPGQETWAAMLFDRSADARLHGLASDPSAQRAKVNWAAQQGFVPVVFTSIDVSGIRATKGGSR